MSIWKHNQPKGKARDGSRDSNTSNSLVKDLNKEKAKHRIKNSQFSAWGIVNQYDEIKTISVQKEIFKCF